MALIKALRRLIQLGRTILFLMCIAGGVVLFSSLIGAQGNPSVVGQWSAVRQWPNPSIHTHLLPTGKVMFYHRGDDPQLWDPATDQITTRPKCGYNIFCSGHSFLTDGRLLVTGGHINDGEGLPNASIYDPFNNSWTRLPNMNKGRWYPTNTTLANGDVLVVSGAYNTDYAINDLPQVYQEGTNTWRNLTGALQKLPMYPFMYLAPNGKVFQAGPNKTTRYLNTAGTGSWTTVAYSSEFRDYGSSVLYDEGKIIKMGGHDPPTATAEVINLGQTTPRWRDVAPMAYARRQLNATLLPDGRVLVTGGSGGAGFDNTSSPVYPAEMWDPSTESWTTMASNARYRGYHSITLLLPDGRVLSAGGDTQLNAEIYSPPYLFKGQRPVISSAPSVVNYGQTFFVSTPDVASINKVTWIRLSSVTHAFDQNQRINQLSFSPTSGGLNVTAPSNANLCPPGHYMLFILNGVGVPSVAKILRVTPASSSSVPNAPSNLSATAVSSSRINLSWQDNSDNESGFKIYQSTDGSSFSWLATKGANMTSYSNTGLQPNTTYYYRVRAYNGVGNSSNSNTASAKTLQ